MFTLMAQQILSRGGLVFGAGFDQDFRVRHMAIEKTEDLAKLRTSKYVQSDLGQAFVEAKAALQSGKPVYFSGTPCQIAALRQFLGKDYPCLYTQDIICHGVPSPSVWAQYLLQQHGEKEIAAINFRDKTLGWNDFSMKINYVDGTSYRELATKDPFERAFLANLTLRPSCYQCQYKTISRVSDLTLADYWGAVLVHPELKDQQGVSLVLVHTEKGKELFSGAAEQLTAGKTDIERATTMNRATTHSVSWQANRDAFFAARQSEPIAALTERLLRMTAAQRAKKTIKRYGSRVKRLIRKIKG